MLNDPLAAQMGLLVMRAENMFDRLRTTGQASTLDPPIDADVAQAWNLVGYIDGKDALVGPDPISGKLCMRLGLGRVFYGFVACSKANPHQYIAVLRGTGDIIEWAIDGRFNPIPHDLCGQAEEGFFTLYRTLEFRPYAGGAFGAATSPAWQGIATAVPDGKLTVIGHSLGSALATYMTLDLCVAAKGAMGDRVTACVFASPRTGDIAFVDFFDQHITTYTLYNYSRDAVPTVPLLFGYSSLPRAIKITPDTAQATISYDRLLPLDLRNLACQHHVVCYAAMLDFHAADWASLPAIDQGSVQCIVGPTGP